MRDLVHGLMVNLERSEQVTKPSPKKFPLRFNLSVGLVYWSVGFFYSKIHFLGKSELLVGARERWTNVWGVE